MFLIIMPKFPTCSILLVSVILIFVDFGSEYFCIYLISHEFALAGIILYTVSTFPTEQLLKIVLLHMGLFLLFIPRKIVPSLAMHDTVLFVISLFIIYHNFLSPPRRGSHVNSDNTHTHTHSYQIRQNIKLYSIQFNSNAFY